MNTIHINPKPRIRHIRMRKSRRIREIDIDNQHSHKREEDIKPQLAETDVRVPGVDLTVCVAVPEEDVLL